MSWIKEEAGVHSPGGKVTIVFPVDRSVTGPSNPDSISESSFVQRWRVVKAMRPVGLGLASRSHCGHFLRPVPEHSQSGGSCSSPIRRLGHRLVTLISMEFSPAWMHPVTSVRKGG